jgi:hypothetical protein
LPIHVKDLVDSLELSEEHVSLRRIIVRAALVLVLTIDYVFETDDRFTRNVNCLFAFGASFGEHGGLKEGRGEGK